MHVDSETTGTSSPRPAATALRARLWKVAGMLCLVTGIIGIVVPLLPTTDFVLLAAYCFSRGSRRWEAWLLGHPRFGPMVQDWRATRAVPLPVKCWATAMMVASSGWAAWVLPPRTGWIPAAVCTLVALYLWSRPTRSGTSNGRGASLLKTHGKPANARGFGLS